MRTDLISVRQLAEMLDCKPSNIRKMAEQGRLPYYKPFGKMLYFSRSEIEEIILGARVPTVAELVNQPR